MSLFKNNFIVGLTAGLTATVLAPVLVPALKRGARPLAKSAIKGGMLLYQKGREAVAHSGEAVEDILAELHAEEEAGARHMPAGGAGPDGASRAARDGDGDGGQHLSAVKTPANGERKGTSDTAPS